MKDFVFFIGFFSLFSFHITLADWADERGDVLERLQDLYETGRENAEKLEEKDKKIGDLTEKVNKLETSKNLQESTIEELNEKVNKLETSKILQENTIELLKSQIEKLQTITTHNENNIYNHDERITNLSGKYLQFQLKSLCTAMKF